MAKNSVSMTLERNMNNQHQLYRIKKNNNVQLRIGHSIQGLPIRLFLNYPMDSNIFLRDKYYELPVINPTTTSNKYDCFDNYAEFDAKLSGAFQFYFTENGSSDIESKIGEGYFIIDPCFTFECSADGTNEQWELDGLVLQTYLSKNLGPFNEWDKRISAALKGNYNMVHFTPLQELGYSRSAYSLRDQLKVNPWFDTGSSTVTWDDIEGFVKRLNDEHHCLSMTDLVYNHTSNDSPWLHEHPECGYNVINSPHLRPAYLLDRVVVNLSTDVSQKKFIQQGLSDTVTELHHLDIIRKILIESIKELRIHEFFLAHIDNAVGKFREFLQNLEKSENQESFFKTGDLVLNHGTYRRFESGIDHGVLATHFYHFHRDIDAACNKYAEVLRRLNGEKYLEIESHMSAAVGNVMANINYRFIDSNGLRINLVSEGKPLMWNYFYHPHPAIVSLKECEEKMDSEPKIMAFNGWVMNNDPLKNFAEATSNVYLRRELIVWGDSVKLRYGNGPEHCPYLWDHMFKYTELTAKIFHAVRLDNCHSTPIHVAQAMLDRARAVRPDLYIVAELFTGSEAVDNIFMNKLGINSLIREAQSAWDSHEEGRLVHKYGGLPVGAFIQQSPQSLQPSIAHALFYDMTHDNESPIAKRSVFDILPSAAIVSMACCAIGSTRGYDELVPHYIDVVNEERFYSTWGDSVDYDTGIVRVKSIINKLHHRLAAEHYTEVFVDQLDSDVVAITRLSPGNYRSVLTVAHTAFHNPDQQPEHRHIKEIFLSGMVTKVLFEARTVRDVSVVEGFKKNKDYINGLRRTNAIVSEALDPEKSSMIMLLRNEITQHDTIVFKDFPAGCVISVEIEMTDVHIQNIVKLKNELAIQFNAKLRSSSVGQCLMKEVLFEKDKSLVSDDNNNNTDTLRQILSELSINDLNRLLFRCHEEEMAEFNSGAYEVANSGRFVFCGLQGVVSEISTIRCNNDLGHPICDNLRQGDWLMDYICQRLVKFEGPLKNVGQWFQRMFAPVKNLPRFLVPTYFEMIVCCAHRLALEECCNHFGEMVSFGSSFTKNLAIGSVMLCSEMRNCKLPELSMHMESRVTLSAGFPHFAQGIWRNWGRDTFIALRGLMILTGRYEEARSIILTYASVVRHGLVPNLLGDGFISRYNARDATWFWLNAIKDYELSQHSLGENGVSVLMMPVIRMYQSDGDDGHHTTVQPLIDVIQEVLQRHADGIRFRERNAGHQIDEHMQDKGFNVEAGLCNVTKFPFGGNEFNCGTWMDKMGSSGYAGNKGRPATPRDGSAVELVGLCASVLQWLIGFSESGKYKYPGITFKGELMTWKDWHNSIVEFFDDTFFIPLDTNDTQLQSNKGIYRDTVNAAICYTNNQFRPNFLVTMTVAPELFKPEHAWHALGLVEKELVGPLGMRTLSPRDWAYRGYYDNNNRSADSSVADGFNYHQGPEWLWLTGYYIRAKLLFSKKMNALNPDKYPTVVTDTIAHVTQLLARLHNHINNSPWRSLPELTNKDGEHCAHSCEAQAWSVACTFEAMHDLLKIEDC